MQDTNLCSNRTAGRRGEPLVSPPSTTAKHGDEPLVPPLGTLAEHRGEPPASPPSHTIDGHDDTPTPSGGRSGPQGPHTSLEGDGAPKEDPRLGTTIDGRYELREVLGSGGMGVVYKAWHTVLKTMVAIKLVKPEKGQLASEVDQMLVEAEAAARVKHPNVVATLDAGRTDDGEAFIVMELVEGVTLEDLLRLETSLTVERSLSLLVQLAAALAEAHKKGVIHRDVKPANCMVVSSASGFETLKVLDFGIAKILEDSNETAKVNPSTRPWHTRHYAAPEVRHGHASSVRSDVYSFGVLAYRLLTKKYPLGESFKRTPPQEHRPELPCDLCELMEEMLETDPDARPQTMVEVRRRLGGGIIDDIITPAPSFDGQTAPEEAAPDTVPEQTIEGPPQHPKALSIFLTWGRRSLWLGLMVSGIVLIADWDSRRRTLTSSTKPNLTVVTGPENPPSIQPSPGETGGSDESGENGEVATDGVPEERGTTGGDDTTSGDDTSGGDDTIGAPVVVNKKPRRRSAADRARASAKRCLSKKKVETCLPIGASAEVKSFTIKDHKPIFPVVRATGTDTKRCITALISNCRLQNGRYEELDLYYEH